MDGRLGNAPAPDTGSRLVRGATRIARHDQAGRHRYEPFPRQSSAVRLARCRLPNEWIAGRDRRAFLVADPRKVAVESGLTKSVRDFERPDLDSSPAQHFSRWWRR